METGNKRSGHRIVRSPQDAQFALGVMFDTGDVQSLEQGIRVCLARLRDPQISELFESYPELLQEYGVKQMLTGGITIRGYTAQQIASAGLLSGLQMIVLFCVQLRSDKDNQAQMEAMLSYILQLVPCTDWLGRLLQMVKNIVGEDYCRRFYRRAASAGSGTRELELFTQDLALQQHIGLMTWFCLMRVFLESVYMLHRNNDQPPK